MKDNGKRLSASILTIEGLAFLFIMIVVWIDEVVDIPFFSLNAPKTPVNFRESIFESAFIIATAVIVIAITLSLFRRIRRLETCLPICSSCKRIRDGDNEWQQLESYLKSTSSISFTHSLCPDCKRKLYPEMK